MRFDVLTAGGIDYAVIGAMAGSVHGIVRASFDADAVLSMAVQRAPELQRTFEAEGFQTTLRRGDPDDPIGALLSLSDGFENRVDLLIGLRGLEPTAFSRAIELTFERTSLRVIGLEDFIAMKVFAGGPQDLADARAAIDAGSRALDHELLSRLAKRSLPLSLRSTSCSRPRAALRRDRPSQESSSVGARLVAHPQMSSISLLRNHPVHRAHGGPRHQIQRCDHEILNVVGGRRFEGHLNQALDGWCEESLGLGGEFFGGH